MYTNVLSFTPLWPLKHAPGLRWWAEEGGQWRDKDTVLPSAAPLPPLLPHCRRFPGQREEAGGSAAAALSASEPETAPRSPAASPGCRAAGSGPPSLCGWCWRWCSGSWKGAWPRWHSLIQHPVREKVKDEGLNEENIFERRSICWQNASYKDSSHGSFIYI